MIAAGRPPAHAGTFYPAAPERLGALVDRLLADAAGRLPAVAGGALVGLLVPHAGLAYSGPIAALGWAAARAVHPTVLVLAGTDHAARAAGVAVWTGGAWWGPLGAVPADAALAERIVGLGAPFRADDAAHLGEHSLEVQLPFIRRACPEASIVPLLVGRRAPADDETAGARLGRLLAGLRAAGERVLLVASSDLAHYPPAGLAPEIDQRVLEPILRLDGAGLDRLEAELETAGLPGLLCGLCGIDPVRFTLAAVGAMGARHSTLLGHATSADAEGGAPGHTVGYAAVAFSA